MLLIKNVITISGILVLFVLIILLFKHNEKIGIIFSWIITLFVVVFLHITLLKNGHISWYILPLAWLLCLVATYFYTHNIRTYFFSWDFAFIVIFVFIIIPPLLASIISSIVYIVKKN
jgi:energy-coupling factor transporter transmembrane protein EcfT